MQDQPSSAERGGDGLDPEVNEEVTGDLEIGISIKNLTKIYGQVRS